MKRLNVLNQLVGASASWSAETCAISRRFLAILSAPYTSIAVKRSSRKWNGKSSDFEFLVERRRAVQNNMCLSKSGNICKQVLIRYYRYVGCIARFPDSHPVKKMIQFRDSEWQEANKKRHWRSPSRVFHRESGAQSGEWEALIASYATSVGSLNWWTAAQNHKQWRDGEQVFLHYACLELSS